MRRPPWLQPGEQYGTIHSTLCAANDRAEDDWFGEREVGGTGGAGEATKPRPKENIGKRFGVSEVIILNSQSTEVTQT